MKRPYARRRESGDGFKNTEQSKSQNQSISRNHYISHGKSGENMSGEETHNNFGLRVVKSHLNQDELNDFILITQNRTR